MAPPAPATPRVVRIFATKRTGFCAGIAIRSFVCDTQDKKGINSMKI